MPFCVVVVVVVVVTADEVPSSQKTVSPRAHCSCGDGGTIPGGGATPPPAISDCWRLALPLNGFGGDAGRSAAAGLVEPSLPGVTRMLVAAAGCKMGGGAVFLAFA